MGGGSPLLSDPQECARWCAFLPLMLCSLTVRTMRDWMPQGTIPLYYLGVRTCAQRGVFLAVFHVAQECGILTSQYVHC